MVEEEVSFTEHGRSLFVVNRIKLHVQVYLLVTQVIQFHVAENFGLLFSNGRYVYLNQVFDIFCGPELVVIDGSALPMLGEQGFAKLVLVLHGFVKGVVHASVFDVHGVSSDSS